MLKIFQEYKEAEEALNANRARLEAGMDALGRRLAKLLSIKDTITFGDYQLDYYGQLFFVRGETSYKGLYKALDDILSSLEKWALAQRAPKIIEAAKLEAASIRVEAMLEALPLP